MKVFSEAQSLATASGESFSRSKETHRNGNNSAVKESDSLNNSPDAKKSKMVKCVVWDLDNTIWDGVLAEDGEVTPTEGVAEVIAELDRRGILHSIASRNSHSDAVRKLEEIGIFEYFLCPQIDWVDKSDSIARIAKQLNIGLDAIVFVDDQQFERDEVRFAHPAVECFDVPHIRSFPVHPRFTPPVITEDASRRRQMYKEGMQRQKDEEAFSGSTEEFLATLNMQLEISPAQEADLERAAELTARTHQLNTTGRAYSLDELRSFTRDPEHLLLIARLDDKYGCYGTIGVTLAQLTPRDVVIKLLLLSCRVMSRGLGMLLMTYLMRQARQRNLGLLAEFIPNERNRMMDMTFRFAGFRECGREGEVQLLRRDLTSIPEYPDYIHLRVGEAVS
jgi:FkbH-like protein